MTGEKILPDELKESDIWMKLGAAAKNLYYVDIFTDIVRDLEPHLIKNARATTNNTKGIGEAFDAFHESKMRALETAQQAVKKAKPVGAPPAP